MLAFVVKLDQLIEVLITTTVFVILGLVIFGIAFFVIEKVTPFSIRKEIEDDQNIAVGILISALILGIAIIIAAAISG
ncbi:MAG: DUF350 domain-containing protein [Pyrinomonadaceae bacterium]|nr:DUF350 domain-containing protein [Pyrinomonadaceae bacterium]MCX7639657.1 DUF350 domain-containing protein [Pyrinomonadaceae bacterium]MDW8303325.1 DUF350 domain-containing protein [Acidobacteriota bacterium]